MSAARQARAGVLGLWVAGCVALASPAGVSAHALEQSYVFLQIFGDRVDGWYELALPDVERVLGLPVPTDGSATAADVAANFDAIVSYLRPRVGFAPNGTPARIEFTGHDLLETDFAQFAVIRFQLDPPEESVRFVDVRHAAFLDELPGHRTLLVIANNWKTNTFDNQSQVTLNFGPDSRQQRLDLSDGSMWRGFRGLVDLGMHHIWIGIDHVLFLTALLLPSVVRRTPRGWTATPRFWPAFVYVVKIVTLFTVAHSLTLAAAALGYVDIPSRVVESIIAASIALAALDVLYPVFRQRIGWVVFGFGLFHGLGFASVLGEIGIPDSFLALSLLGFNVGVEIGQIAIVAVVFPFLYLLRTTWLYRRATLTAGPGALIAISLYWFTERAFEVDLPAGSIVNAVVGLVA